MVASSSAPPDGAALLPREGAHGCVHILSLWGWGERYSFVDSDTIMDPVLWCLEQQPKQSRSAQKDEWAYLGVGVGRVCSSFWLDFFFFN